MRSPDLAASRVLVLDGHTNQALACVRSLGRAGATVFVASPEPLPLAGWSRYCRSRFRQSGETVAAFAALRRWAREHAVDVVLPQRERSCVLCAGERDEWERAGVAVGCGPTDMLLSAFDKARTLELARTCDVRIPPTGVPTSLAECHAAAAAVGYPCILKPRFSDFWDGERFVADHGPQYVPDAAALEATALATRQGELWPVVQGLVGGRGKGVFALYDHGEPVVWFAHERLRDFRPSGSGSSLRRSVAVDPRLREPASRLLSAMRWHGPAMVEFRDDGVGEPYLMEVNGRFWGSLELAVAAGVDFPALWTGLLRGRPLHPPVGYQTGVTSRWLWGDFKRVLYILAGPPAGCRDPYPGVLAGLREVLGPQPPGTTSEMWSPDDRWPAVGEWVQGARELGRLCLARVAAALSPTPRPVPAPPASRPLEAVRG
jgi:predicted ATP-grasp superfamily ATP-dependent carboligase